MYTKWKNKHKINHNSEQLKKREFIEVKKSTPSLKNLLSIDILSIKMHLIPNERYKCGNS